MNEYRFEYVYNILYLDEGLDIKVKAENEEDAKKEADKQWEQYVEEFYDDDYVKVELLEKKFISSAPTKSFIELILYCDGKPYYTNYYKNISPKTLSELKDKEIKELLAEGLIDSRMADNTTAATTRLTAKEYYERCFL